MRGFLVYHKCKELLLAWSKSLQLESKVTTLLVAAQDKDTLRQLSELL